MPNHRPMMKFIAAGIAAGLFAGAAGYLLLAYMRPSDPTLLRSIDLEDVTWLMDDIAAGDTNYSLRLATCEAGETKGCRKIILSARLTVQVAGADPVAFANDWNAAHDVGRVFVTTTGPVFSIDIDLYGGVSPTNVQTQIRAWFDNLNELRRSLAG